MQRLHRFLLLALFALSAAITGCSEKRSVAPAESTAPAEAASNDESGSGSSEETAGEGSDSSPQG